MATMTATAPALLLRALCATAVSAAGAAAWTKLLSRLRRRGRLTHHQARKLMHVTTAPLFLLTTPLYPPLALSRLLAAAVPLSYTLSILRRPARSELLRAVARDAARDDAFATAAYAFSTGVLTAVGWRSCAATYVAVFALCFGDGFAGVVGSALPSPRLPHTRNKSLAGSVSCFVATLASSAAVLAVAPVPKLSAAGLLLSAAAACVVETLPVQDNLTVPFSAFAVARLCS